MKCKAAGAAGHLPKSPPSRGAWIEIFFHILTYERILSRPPRGGRGLKFCCDQIPTVLVVRVAPLAGGVD